jgi:enterochelin esterase family protein
LLILPIHLMSQVSPDILDDGRVTFRLKAPKAQSVSVKAQWTKDPIIMVKDDEGLWAGTTGEAVPPGVWEYGIIVDGLRVVDPRNSAIKPQRWPQSSILHINSNPPAHWDLQHIPHGTLHHHDYWSDSLQAWRKLVVYTPPGYNDAKRPLPVLYLSHGFSDNQAAWSVHGKANNIADSLIHLEKARPMLIVMPDAHPVDPEARVKEIYNLRNRQAFAEEMVTEIIPFVESHYIVQGRPSGRAFAGLSMGGGHAITIAFQHHDKFSQIAAFSSSPPTVEYLQETANVQQMNEDLKLFWMICGDKDYLLERNEETHRTMTELGIRHEYEITAGDDHSWPVWRRYLVKLLPKLFQ